MDFIWGISDGNMISLSYDVWDINGVFIEILKNDKIPFHELEYPYLMLPFNFKHRTLS